MGYRELRATPELWQDVACVWFDDRLQREQLVVPDGCIDIIWIKGQTPSIAGPQTVSFVASPQTEPVIGVRFRPGRAPSFLGLPADALLNGDLPLADVWGDAAKRLADDLEQSRSPCEALQLVQLAATRQRTEGPDDLVSAAVTQLRRAPATSVEDLGDALGISTRQLLRRFTNMVGYGPKVLGRVLRFQRFMRLLYAPRAQDWDLARLAAEAGYADHAHLTRECTQLSGLAPSALRTR